MVIWVVLAVPSFPATGEPGGELPGSIVIQVPGVRSGTASRIDSGAGKPAPGRGFRAFRFVLVILVVLPFPAQKACLLPFSELGGPHCSWAICFGR